RARTAAPDPRSFPTRRSSDLEARPLATFSRTVRAPSSAATDAAESELSRASIPLRSLAIRESSRLTLASSFLHVSSFVSRAAREIGEHTSELQSLAYLVCRLL